MYLVLLNSSELLYLAVHLVLLFSFNTEHYVMCSFELLQELTLELVQELTLELEELTLE